MIEIEKYTKWCRSTTIPLEKSEQNQGNKLEKFEDRAIKFDLGATAMSFPVGICEDVADLVASNKHGSLAESFGGEKQIGGQILTAEWQVATPLGAKAGLLSPAAENKLQPQGLVSILISRIQKCICFFLCGCFSFV